METTNRSKNGCTFFKWDDQGQGGSPNFSKTFTSTNSSKNFDKTFQNLRKSLPVAASKSFSTLSTKPNAINSDEKGRTIYQPNLPVTKNVASLLTNFNNAANVSEKSTSALNLPTQNLDKNSEQNPQQISNHNTNQQSRPVITASKNPTYLNAKENTVNKAEQNRPSLLASKSSTSIIAKENTVNVEQNRPSMTVSKSSTNIIARENTVNSVEQNRPSMLASKSFTTFSSIQKSDLLRPTLGPSRRSNIGLLHPPQPGVVDVHTPEMKRARLNFNCPVLHGGRNLASSTRSLVPQYFGNVPFHLN